MDPTAIVENGASIGENTQVWHHSHIRAGARIGAECTLGKNVYIDAGVIIGDRVKIQNNVSIYHGVIVEDEVFLGPSCVFTNDRYPRAVSPDWEVTQTIVSRGASVGANATVVCGVSIGAWATIGAGAVVTHDVEAHELVLGNPARRSGWVCNCGRVIVRGNVPAPQVLRCQICGGLPQ